MAEAVLWFGFIGAWLLFTGPVYQAKLELEAEDDASERLHALSEQVPAPPPVSPWWWLLPPVRLVLSSRRRDRYHRALLGAISPEDLALVTRYLAIARGWLIVAGGAWLIALKETWELVEHHEAGLPAYVAVVLVATGIGLGVTVASARRQRSILEQAHGDA